MRCQKCGCTLLSCQCPDGPDNPLAESPVTQTLPATLQAVKDQARAVCQESRDIASEDAERSWQTLIAVAQESLGELWEYVVNKTRPHNFPQQGPPFGDWHHSFEIQLPGHRHITAPFDGNSDKGWWWRSYYPGGGKTLDVDGGRANWMVAARDGQPWGGYRYLPTYHQTLGSALLTAEEAK